MPKRKEKKLYLKIAKPDCLATTIAFLQAKGEGILCQRDSAFLKNTYLWVARGRALSVKQKVWLKNIERRVDLS